jgi:hypothetical protein
MAKPLRPHNANYLAVVAQEAPTPPQRVEQRFMGAFFWPRGRKASHHSNVMSILWRFVGAYFFGYETLITSL